MMLQRILLKDFVKDNIESLYPIIKNKFKNNKEKDNFINNYFDERGRG